MKHVLATCLTFILVLAACVTTPVTHRRQLVIVPESQMNSMGEQAYDEMLKTEKKSKDLQLVARVTEIGKRIAAASGKSFKWEFTLFENEQVNAFCLPGGKVGIFTGILATAQTNAGLAAVLGHEVAHAVAHHGAERVSQGLLVAGVLIGADQAMKDSKYRQIVLAGLGLGANVGVVLPYSRWQESEADTIGLQYMAKAGYDPKEAVGIWERMAKLGGSPPEIVSTHPDPKRRARELEAQLAKVQPLFEQSDKVPTAALL